MSKPLNVLLLGAGSRGFFAYGPYALAHPQALKFVAVAEPNPVRRARFAETHAIPEAYQFESWERLSPT